MLIKNTLLEGLNLVARYEVCTEVKIESRVVLGCDAAWASETLVSYHNPNDLDFNVRISIRFHIPCRNGP